MRLCLPVQTLDWYVLDYSLVLPWTLSDRTACDVYLSWLQLVVYVLRAPSAFLRSSGVASTHCFWQRLGCRIQTIWRLRKLVAAGIAGQADAPKSAVPD